MTVGSDFTSNPGLKSTSGCSPVPLLKLLWFALGISLTCPLQGLVQSLPQQKHPFLRYHKTEHLKPLKPQAMQEAEAGGLSELRRLRPGWATVLQRGNILSMTGCGGSCLWVAEAGRSLSFRLAWSTEVNSRTAWATQNK